GPTAVGKSAIAVELAKMVDGEIISADSMQIYKGLNVGTAKVTTEEMQGITHHLIDILEPWEEYNASLFADSCKKIVAEILSRNKTPIIVGGTGLYINGLINGFNFGESEKNAEFRKGLENLTNEELREKVLELDSNLQIDFQNRRRLIRALERLTYGGNITNSDFTFDYELFVILDDREKIYQRINSRVDKMEYEGLLEEAKYVMSLKLNEESLCLKAIGYKELFPYLKCESTLNECKEVLKQKTRNYAKRQITYINQFKNYTQINFNGVVNTAKQILEKLRK
ncbi:MAG: tRNA (adenosine(37)-N6)-dimethylallyltransferase MiaA, partial [Clostridia bacterium]|nr:tRNA (adenosine(37)-N6)-dimethylallyltransferase MiaA [Clostridia bacterium]